MHARKHPELNSEVKLTRKDKINRTDKHDPNFFFTSALLTVAWVGDWLHHIFSFMFLIIPSNIDLSKNL